MNQRIAIKDTTRDWRQQMRDLVTSSAELLALLGLRAEQVGLSNAANEAFPLKVPRSFVDRMTVGDPDDPLLRQILPRSSETETVGGFSKDPVGETGDSNPSPGIIQKYRGRALLIVTGGCAIHCRYCFRRHFPYGDNQNSKQQWHSALEYIRQDKDISEVILSGGDPLVAGDEQISELVDEIATIAHVRRLRVHSRLPIVIPERITEELIGAISRPGIQSVMVVHANHAQELDPAVEVAVRRLQRRGIPTLNQAVLLAGINDSADAQAALAERLFASGILPYYLHLLDKVEGAAHFDVSEAQAQAIHRELCARLPGYLVPKLVREVEGAPAKVPLGPGLEL